MGEEVTAGALDEVFPNCERVLTDLTLFLLLGELASEQSVGDAEAAIPQQFFLHFEESGD